MYRDWKAAAVGVVSLGFAQLSAAAGTPAGTAIDNTAVINYEVSGSPLSQTSNTHTVTVAELLDVDVTLQSGPVAVASPDTARELLFVVTNTGNGTETLSLALDSALGGDDFDPIPAVPSIYFDSDSSGDLSAPDTPYNPGVNDPNLAADASVDILIVNDIPAALADGNIGFSQLSASSTTGTGAPGDVFPGLGDGGVDAVVGTSGGTDADTGQYVVGDIQFTVAKTATVSDPFGGTQPVPGAQVSYQIVLTPTGSATATNSAFSDPIPPNTTFVPGTITLNSVPLTDAADADAGEFITLPGPEIAVALGDLTAASGAQTVTFDVTID